MEDIFSSAVNLVTSYVKAHGMNFVYAVLIFIAGKIISRLAEKLVKVAMEKAKTDQSIITFTGNLVYIAGMIFTIIASISKLGIPTASFIAVIGAAGLAIGLAFQGALSNIAAGFLVIFFRPFKVGDLIEAAGSKGTVREIELFTTTLTTPENKTVVIPNGILTSDKITNYTETETIRVDMTFGVSYEDDIDKVRSVIQELIDGDSRILKDPAPLIAVCGHADSSVNFAVRPWTKADDYWNVYFDMHEKIKKAFDKNGISIPFPQRDVHIKKEAE